VDKVRPISQDFRRHSSVLKPVSGDDLQSSIAQTLFGIVLPSGKIVQLRGAEICKVDHMLQQRVLR